MRVGLALGLAALAAFPVTLAEPPNGLPGRPNGPPGGPQGPPTAPNGPPPTTSFGCPEISPGPVSGYYLAEQFESPAVPDVTSIEAIRQTMALYALAIDGRNFEALRKVFTIDTRANYSDPIGVLNGVQAIIDTLPPGLANFVSTQHHLGTQYIDICSPNSAVSVTYFQATHFFTPYNGVANPVDGSQVLIDRAQYQDVWARQGDGSWRITNRNLVRMVSLALPLAMNLVCSLY
ncbi:hypothetical protein OHC33_005556 [Knufia fluminis]|uniref:SnoaL-like domain-containing protein n=1 Tax=Knufia fluminis TaxID=191047 RepID=A0AAN8I449_9EURO|nr:hypothetical protein OHC33_005556 [Knufia fluminis]